MGHFAGLSWVCVRAPVATEFIAKPLTADHGSGRGVDDGATR